MMLWCPGPRTLVMLYRFDSLKIEDLEAIPWPARKDAEAAPPALRDLLSQQRINKQSLGWAAGQLERPALLNNLLPFAPGLAGKAQLLTNVRAFTLSLYSQEGMVLDGAFRTGDEKGTGLVRKQIEEMNPHTFKSYKVAVPPPGADAAAQWVTLQIRGEVQTFRELLGPK